jgi:5-methylcytosine-specific restriction endonuclease McrA
MPLDITTFTLVDKPVTLQEGLKILERDGYRCRYCGLDGKASFENGLVMSVDFVVPRARKGKKDPNNLVACYRSFDEAKTEVLKRREELRKAWQAKSAAPSR